MGGRGDEVVNVCFHGIGIPGRALEPGEDAYWVTEDAFGDILDLLAAHPEVRISFDDGNASDVAIGLPALLARGLRASFFLLAGRVDQPGSVGAAGVRALVEAGMAVGSHGMDHRPWAGLTGPDRDVELRVARERLSACAGVPVDTAACPLGRYDRAVLADLRSLGYRTVYTSDRRRSRAGDWLQHRYSVRAADTPATLRWDVLEPPAAVERGLAALKGRVKAWR
ncbi:MAG TPA: polysaccharide deacetylase family protein [Acidimicrobiales bacterium]|nr:polysaccharide deacetylase family protein [Acidimicrobiales bacterium]